MKSPLILVTGATGTVGREVVKQLTEAGQKVRALVRNPAKANFDGAVEVVEADLADPRTLATVFDGVEKALALSNGPEISRLEGNAFDAAKEAGVKYIVKISAQESFQDHLAGTIHAQSHFESEQRLRESGISWTMLRPGYFASNLLLPGFVDKEQGVIFAPSGGGKEIPIDPRDIAAVAVKALTTPGREGKIYELTGPEFLSYSEMMEKISAVAGRRFRHVDVTEEEARARMLAAGFPPPFAEAVLRHYAAVKEGRMRAASGVHDALGREALTFDDWARDNAVALK